MENQFEKGMKNPLDTDDDTNAIRKIGNEIKTTIFRMVALITKEQEVPLYLALFIPLLEFIPILGFSFYDQVF